LSLYIHHYVGGRCVRCGISSDRPVRTNNSHISAVGRCDERCWPILHEIRQPTLASPPPSGVPKRHRFSKLIADDRPVLQRQVDQQIFVCQSHVGGPSTFLFRHYTDDLYYSLVYILLILLLFTNNNDIQSRSGPITARQTRAVDGQSN